MNETAPETAPRATHPDADYRPVMLRLVEDIERLSRRLAERSVETERLRADAEAALRDAGWVVRYKIARIFGVPPWVIFGPSARASVRRRRERLRRMHEAYRRRQ